MNKIFLGGTCNNSTWRDKLIPKLKVPHFNPVVEDWTPEYQAIENLQKEICNIYLYVITRDMTGVYSIAELVDSAHDKTKTTIFVIDPKGFTEGQIKSLKAVSDLVYKQGVLTYDWDDFDYLVEILNKFA